MRRFLPIAVVAALVGCGGSDFDYAKACERVPDVRETLDYRDDAPAADLRAAIAEIGRSGEEVDFLVAVTGILGAREQLELAFEALRASDPTQTTETDGELQQLNEAAETVVDRYREALREAELAGVENCGGLTSVKDLPITYDPGPPKLPTADVATPAGLSAAEEAAFEHGRDQVEEAGCLACHRIGSEGGALAPNLSAVGERLTRAQLERSLVNPTAPMPSFGQLPERDRRDLVTFMTYLREG